MWPKSGRNFLSGAAMPAVVAVLAFVTLAWAANHQELNGRWQLVPSRSELNGEPALETGSVIINDREGNIYVERSFNFDAPSQSTTTTFATDARAIATIKQEGFRSKAKWEDGVLKVVTTQDGNAITERYSRRNDGTMMLEVERPNHSTERLFFERE